MGLSEGGCCDVAFCWCIGQPLGGAALAAAAAAAAGADDVEFAAPIVSSGTE